MKPSIDLTKNEKQKAYFNKVLENVLGGPYKYFAYGGAIRGGKTYVTLAILVLLCRIFKGSRWVCVRKNLPLLEKTTIPSLRKLLGNSPNWKWHLDKSNMRVIHIPTQSIIFFYPENLIQDPELNAFLGLECNGFFLEQAEELSEKMWAKAVERAGSWYIDKMPPPFIFTTMNPTLTWSKAKFYEQYADGTLEAPYYFLEALPNDNPFVTKDQWDAWATLDEVSYKRFVKGDWSSFAIDKPFLYNFVDKKHVVSGIQFDPLSELQISFDFNVDPITAVVGQGVGDQIRLLKEYRLENSNIYELCDRIRADYPTALYLVTGDAAGRQRSALAQGNINYYTVIRQKLNLSEGQLKVPAVNPAVSDSRVLFNSILQNFNYVVDKSCTFAIEDFKYVEVDDNGDIDKKKDKHRSHLLDAERYRINTFYKHLIKGI